MAENPRLEITIDAITSGLKKGLEEARKELNNFNQEVSNLSKSGFKNALEAEKLALAGSKTEAQQARTALAQLALQKRQNQGQTTALSGSYREAQQRLTALGQSIRNAQDGFRSTNPVIQSQIAEYRKLNDELKDFDKQLGNNYRNVGNYGSALSSVAPSIAGFATLGGAVLGVTSAVKGAYNTISEFDNGLKNVEKTTGLSGKAIQELGLSFVEMSRKLQTTSAIKLTEYGTIAGQLGVKGTKDIMNFTESLAKLEIASNISGEQGGAEIARLLTLVDGGVQNVKKFADEIVNLGNNFPATEKEILANAEAIAQNVGIYKIGRQEVLAFATATKSIGVEAELVGSTFNRTLAIFERAIRTGDGLQSILKLIGGTQGELSKRFKDDASGVFVDFIGALNKTDKAGKSVNEQLENIGLNSVRDQKVIQSLAVNGYDVLIRSLDTAKTSIGAVDQEHKTASEKIINQTNRMSIAWENFILTIDRGEGAIGRFSKASSNLFANMIDGLSDISKGTDTFLGKLEAFSAFSPIAVIERGIDVGNRNADLASRGDSPYLNNIINSTSKWLDLNKEYLTIGQQITKQQAVSQNISLQEVKSAKNKAFWTEKVAEIQGRINSLDSTKAGGAEWKELNKQLVEAQKNLNLYSQKSLNPTERKGKSQVDIIKEANEALQSGQINNLRGIDKELERIDVKWQKISEKINQIANVDLRNALTEQAKLGRDLEKTLLAVDTFAKSKALQGLTGRTSGISLSGSASGVPSSAGLLNSNAGKIAKNIPKIIVDDSFSKQFTSTLRRGLSSTFNDLFSNIGSLSEKNYEIDQKYNELRAKATAEQIADLNKMQALERSINNGLTNTLTKIGSSFSSISGNILSSALSTGISSGNFSDLTNMFTGKDKAIGYGALGSLAGSALGSAFKPSNVVGQSLSGALSGAGSGLAIGTAVGGPVGSVIGAIGGALIGGLSSLFGSKSRKKQEELAQKQLEVQQKQLALQERQAKLAFTSSIVGQQTNQGVITNIDRDAFGNLVSVIDGQQLKLILQRTDSGRG